MSHSRQARMVAVKETTRIQIQNVFVSRVNRTSDEWDVWGQGTGDETWSVGFGWSTCLVLGGGLRGAALSPEIRPVGRTRA